MLQNSNAIEDGGYVIDRSLRFMAASSQYLTRMPSVAGNRKTWTWSGWVKRGSLATGAGQILFSTGPTGAGQTWNQYYFETDNTLRVINFIGGSASFGRNSDALYRDPSAWYHVVIAFDTTQATDSNRIKFYVNGSLITTSTTSGYSAWPSLNYDGPVNNTVTHGVGGIASNSYFDGYQAEVHFIDGQALTPSSFGEINSATGQWVAKKYTGTYGTNGFYLDFKDGTSTTTLGQDKSGNNNHWSLTNFTRSAGVNDCWMLDVPAGNGSVSAVQPSSNYAIIDPLFAGANSISKSNLAVTYTSASIAFSQLSNFTVSVGRWYHEANLASFSVGDAKNNVQAFGYRSRSTINSRIEYGWRTDGSIMRHCLIYNLNGVLVQRINIDTVSPISTDILAITFDVDLGIVTSYKNGIQTAQIVGIPNVGDWTPSVTRDGTSNAATWNFNFGQRSFAYTPPTGFKAICTSNLPTPSIVKPSDHFNVSLWTGDNSSSRAITGLNFSPDFTWIKCRSKNYNNHLVDSVRGPTNSLISNSTNAQSTNNIIGYVSSLDSNGFTVNFGTTSGAVVNEVSQNYVAWNWRASESIPVTNTDGSITSTVSSNPAAGFSIVTYTGTGANATVGHGLGKIPAFIIVKNATSGVSYWCVQHKSLPVPSVLRLNDTTASASGANIWSLNNNTSLIFNISEANETNRPSNTMVAYCFAEIDGYSKFGSYTGNGSADGPFVHCGFAPAFVMIKCSSTGGVGYDWVVNDTSRDKYNVASLYLQPNKDLSESSTPLYDILSNGFKLRNTNVSQNANGATYIYIAFAETPLQYSNGR